MSPLGMLFDLYICVCLFVYLFTVSFEDKKRKNFEKGQMELERRRAMLREEQQREKVRITKLTDPLIWLVGHASHVILKYYYYYSLFCLVFCYSVNFKTIGSKACFTKVVFGPFTIINTFTRVRALYYG